MQVADAVLRPPRERQDRLVRARVDRQIARIIRRRRRQRDADEQIKGRGSERAKLPKAGLVAFSAFVCAAMQFQGQTLHGVIRRIKVLP